MTHAQRYIMLTSLTKRDDKLDSSYHAAFYLLSSDAEIYAHALKYVNKDGIGFQNLKRNTRQLLDEYQRQIVDVAHNLFSWNSTCKVTPFDLSRMDTPVLELVINAIHIAADHAEIQIQSNDGVMALSLSWARYEKTRAIYKFFQGLQEDSPESFEDEPER